MVQGTIPAGEPLATDDLVQDILNAALKDADGVFHFAALWLLQCHEYPDSAFETNIRGTFNVLQACVANGVQRLVYSSSASVYGDAVEEPMTEDSKDDERPRQLGRQGLHPLYVLLSDPINCEALSFA